MEINKEKLIYTIINVIAVIACIWFIWYSVERLCSRYSSPVEEMNSESQASKDAKSKNDSLIKDNNKIIKELEDEKERIYNLNNDSTLIEFYRLIGK